jgi:hypothetical protein
MIGAAATAAIAAAAIQLRSRRSGILGR